MFGMKFLFSEFEKLVAYNKAVLNNYVVIYFEQSNILLKI